MEKRVCQAIFDTPSFLVFEASVKPLNLIKTIYKCLINEKSMISLSQVRHAIKNVNYKGCRSLMGGSPSTK